MNTVHVVLVFTLVSAVSFLAVAGNMQNTKVGMRPVHYRYVDSDKELYFRIHPLVNNHSVITVMYSHEGSGGESGTLSRTAATLSITAHNSNSKGIDWFEHEVSRSYGEHHKFICFRGDAYRAGPGSILGKKVAPFRDDEYGFADTNGLHLNSGNAIKIMFEELNRIERQWREGKTDFSDELEKVESYVYLIDKYPDQYQLKDL